MQLRHARLFSVSCHGFSAIVTFLPQLQKVDGPAFEPARFIDASRPLEAGIVGPRPNRDDKHKMLGIICAVN
jgi:hypothetical protein